MEKKTSFWNWISDKYIEEIRQFSQIMHFEPGESVFIEGEEYRGFFVVEKGLFKVFHYNQDGKEALMKVFFPHEVIAAMPAVNPELKFYPANCQAVSEGELLMIQINQLKQISSSFNNIMSDLSKGVTDCTLFFMNKYNSSLLENAEERVTQFFNSLGANKKEIEILLPKNQIALLLSMTPETFSRTLRNLKDRSVLIQDKNRYRIVTDE